MIHSSKLEILARINLTVFHVFRTLQFLRLWIESLGAEAPDEHPVAHDADLVGWVCQQRGVCFEILIEEDFTVLGAHVCRLVELDSKWVLIVDLLENGANDLIGCANFVFHLGRVQHRVRHLDGLDL